GVQTCALPIFEIDRQGVVTAGIGAGGEVGDGLLELLSEGREPGAQCGAALRVVFGVVLRGVPESAEALCRAARGEGLQRDAEVEQSWGLGERHGGDEESAA